MHTSTADLFAASRRTLFSIVLFALGLSIGGAATAATPAAAAAPAENGHRPSLDELAATSDVIGIAQVYYTNYQVSHGYPIAGKAYLRMLITYRSDEPVEKIEVADKGLHAGECYFPITDYNEDGPRFLVFLSRDGEGNYIGNPRLCKIPVGVTTANSYAVPYPRPELRLGSAGEAAIQDIEFNDANVTIDVSDITRALARIRAEEAGGELRDERIVFTRGIPIANVRKLMGEENLKLSRSRR